MKPTIIVEWKSTLGRCLTGDFKKPNRYKTTNNIILLNFDIAEDLRLPKKSKLMDQIGHELFQILSQYPNLTLYLHY